MTKKLIFLLSSALLLFYSPALNPVSAQPTCQQCPLYGTPDYIVCRDMYRGIICGTNPPYSCCYIPPGCLSTTPVCLPPPPCDPPNQCVDEMACPASYIIPFPQAYCSAVSIHVRVCCAPTGIPAPTLGPSPTPYVGPIPGTCGDHLQPCCGIVSTGDPSQGTCNPQPTGFPSLFCTGIAGGQSVCCLREDPDPTCYTGLGVTPIPRNRPRIFCNSNGFSSPLYSDRIFTAVGCIFFTPPAATISQLLTLFRNISSGIAVFLIIIAAIQIITAGGNPRQVQAGKELLTATLVGISFILLSVLMLNFIGVQILNLGPLGFRS